MLELCRAAHPGLQTQMACQGEEQERERERSWWTGWSHTYTSNFTIPALIASFVDSHHRFYLVCRHSDIDGFGTGGDASMGFSILSIVSKTTEPAGPESKPYYAPRGCCHCNPAQTPATWAQSNFGTSDAHGTNDGT